MKKALIVIAPIVITVAAVAIITYVTREDIEDHKRDDYLFDELL